jgi:hypothetical protein
VPTPIPTPFGGRLASFIPTSDCPSLYLYRCVYLVRVVQDYIHPFDHRLLQPGLYVRRLLYIALDHHLVVAHEDRHDPWALVPTLSQEDV